MSWENKINNIEFEIITGDGKKFTPLVKITGRSREFNTAIFDFINVEGSLVERKKGRSKEHTLNFYFQGENNITDVAEFDESASDSRAWTITHPFYGVITGQPISIEYNDESLNVTAVTVKFWESITADLPKTTTSVTDEIDFKNDEVLETSAAAAASDLKPSTADISKQKAKGVETAAAFNNTLTDEVSAEFSNAVSAASAALDNLITNPLAAVSAAQAVLALPAKFNTELTPKLNSYKTAFNTLKSNLDSVSDKVFFEANAAACVSAMAVAAANTSEADFITRDDLVAAIESILDVYNEYITINDNNQVEIYSVTTAYTPNINTQTALYNLVTFAIGNLYNFAFEAKQLRTVYTDKKTNVILLSHKYLGPDVDDLNLHAFIKLNNIKLRELFSIKKNRKINYFV